MGTSSLAINQTLYKSLSYDPIRHLQPITLLTNIPNALAVNAALPVRSVAELIQYARLNPGKLNYSSSGIGGTNHLGMELLKSMAGVDIVHVPYKGGGPALIGLLANEAQVMLSPITAFVQHEQAGKVRILGVASPRRVAGADVPTVAEAAGLPGYESGVWMALFAPAGTPRMVVDKLSQDANRFLRQPDLVAEYERTYFVPGGGSPEDLARLLLADTDRLGRLIRTLGLAGSEGAKG
jgi:tripartite-type tricarboxylate transporter receptor subunit TctC